MNDIKRNIVRLYYENKNSIFIYYRYGVYIDYSLVLRKIADYIVSDGMTILDMAAVDSQGYSYEGWAVYKGQAYPFFSTIEGCMADSHEQKAAIDIICNILKDEINVDLWQQAWDKNKQNRQNE